VIDNSNNYIKCQNEVIISPNVNLGYIGGFKLAINSLINHSQYRIVFSNSDIDILYGFNEIFDDKMNFGSVIIPRIISPKGDQNPHLLKKKKKTYWIIRYLISCNNFFWFLWNSFSYLKRFLFHRYKKHSSANIIYAGHGSFYIFNCIDFTAFILDQHNFLYGEEIHFAEFFLKNNIKLCYNPNLIIQHNEHASTSILKVNVRRIFFKESFSSILSKYYT
jgi:hypothetical protein